MASHPQPRGVPLPSLEDNEADHGSQGAESTAAKTEPTQESLLIPRTSRAAHSKSKRYRRSVALWWQELIAAILLSAAAIASFATLYPYQGNPLPDWPYSITLGALLSTYSVILRLAATFLLSEGLAQLKWRWFDKGGGMPLRDLVLHDDATRGPIGSLRLLWRLPWPMTWQWMGCALVIIALLTGPFTQQVLHYDQCQVPVEGIKGDATIPRTSVFFGQGYHQGAITNTLTVAEQNSLNAGVYALGSVGGQCSSGNCTFDPYTSVGYCSACSDISAEVEFIIYEENITTFLPGSLSVQNSDQFGLPHYAAAGTVLNNGSSPWTIIIGPPKGPSPYGSVDSSGTFADCSNNRTWACQGYAAATCTLSPCIRRYQANITNGVFQEAVVDTWTDAFDGPPWGDGSLTYSAVNKSCLHEDEKALFRELNFTLNGDSPWLSYGGSHRDFNTTEALIYLAPVEQALLDRGCLYGVDEFFDNGLAIYLNSSAFAGNVTGDRSGSATNTAFGGPQLLLTIYNYGDISFERTKAVWENISLSLTNHMRLNPGSLEHSIVAQYDLNNASYSLTDASKPAPGQSLTMKTCLQVRWPWLALPTALAVLTLVFFTGVLLSSGGLTRDVRTWKSSPLPLLFFGFPVTDLSAESQHVSDLNKVAKRTRICLGKDEDGNMVLQRQGGIAEHDSEI